MMEIKALANKFKLVTPPQRIDNVLTLSISPEEDINVIRDAFSNPKNVSTLKYEDANFVGYRFDHISITPDATNVVMIVMTDDERFTYMDKKIEGIKGVRDDAINDLTNMVVELYSVIDGLTADITELKKPKEEEHKDEPEVTPEEPVEEPKEESEVTPETPAEEPHTDIPETPEVTPEEPSEEPNEESTDTPADDTTETDEPDVSGDVKEEEFTE